MTGPDMKRRVEEVLEIIGLRDRAGDRAKEYSGGMKRRLNIRDRAASSPPPADPGRAHRGGGSQSRNAILESVEELAGAGSSTGACWSSRALRSMGPTRCKCLGVVPAGREG